MYDEKTKISARDWVAKTKLILHDVHVEVKLWEDSDKDKVLNEQQSIIVDYIVNHSK